MPHPTPERSTRGDLRARALSALIAPHVAAESTLSALRAELTMVRRAYEHALDEATRARAERDSAREHLAVAHATIRRLGGTP